MKDISIIYLENNKENKKIVSELILKDISQKCFANKDAEGNIIPIENMAGLYLEYTDMYGIKESDKFIGLLSLTNENEISIFVEPDYQGKGIGKYSLLLFERLLKEKYKLNTLVAEMTSDNIESIKMFSNNGYVETNESREVPINNVYVKVTKYIKHL